MSQPGLEAMQSGSVGTQAAPVVDPGIPGVQPTSVGSVPVPPQLYLHDTRYCLPEYIIVMSNIILKLEQKRKHEQKRL